MAIESKQLSEGSMYDGRAMDKIHEAAERAVLVVYLSRTLLCCCGKSATHTLHLEACDPLYVCEPREPRGQFMSKLPEDLISGQRLDQYDGA